MKRALAGLIAALAVAASAASSAPTRTGLHGYVTRGPVTPVCFEDKPCDEPAAGVVLLFTRSDGRRVRTVTRATGFYRVGLPGGRYTVSAAVDPPQRFTVRSARVVDGRDGRLDFYIDTGIQ